MHPKGPAPSARKRTRPDPDGDAKTRASVKPKSDMVMLESMQLEGIHLMKKLRWVPGLQTKISAPK